MANFKLKESASKKSLASTTAGTGIIPQAGFIMPFAGTTAPSGWALCDGTNGTPDLRGYFVIGATSSSNIGGTVGSTNHTHNYAFSSLTVSSETNTHSTLVAGNLAAGGAINVNHTHDYTFAVNTPSHYSANYINWGNGNTTTRTFRSHDHVGTANATTDTASATGSNHTHNAVSGNIDSTITETGHSHLTDVSPSGTTTSGETIAGNILMNYIMKL